MNLRLFRLAARIFLMVTWLPVAATALPGLATDEGHVPRQSATFPFTPLCVGQTVYGLPLVRMRVNEARNGTFLFDTGTNISLVTDVMAAKLGLAPQPVRSGGQAFLVEGRPARSVVASALQAGTMRLNDVQLIVVKRSTLVAVAQHPLDGIIGTNVLRSFPILFDFPQHRITVWRTHGLTAAELADAGFTDADAVMISDPRSLFLYSASVRFTNGVAPRQEDLLVDTGAERTTISQDTAQEIGLRPVGKSAPANFLAGSYPALAARVAAVRVGGVSLTGLLVGYPAQPGAERRLLGADVLSHFRVLMDFPDGKMYLREPPATAPPPAAAGKP